MLGSNIIIKTTNAYSAQCWYKKMDFQYCSHGFATLIERTKSYSESTRKVFNIILNCYTVTKIPFPNYNNKQSYYYNN